MSGLVSSTSRIMGQFARTDIDVFIYGLSVEEATNKVYEIIDVIKTNTNRNLNIVMSQHAITVIGLDPFKHVQIILRLYR